MKCTRSKSGLPIVAESGGGATNTGKARIVCGSAGGSLRPLFVPRGYSNGEHALFVVDRSTVIVEASHDRNGEYVKVSRVTNVGTINDPEEVILELVGKYENGDGNIPEQYAEAVNAALSKSKCYHCREPHFIDGGTQ